MLLAVVAAGLAAVAFCAQDGAAPAARRKEGLAAWDRIHSILTSPRCLNCHTAADFPQQGDDRHRHLFNVVRGPAGDGVAGLRCATCHQRANADRAGVPGAAGWRLAPLKMAWQDAQGKALPGGRICRNVRGNITGPDLIKHHKEEPLVSWAFSPGRRRDGTRREPPPLTQARLVEATVRWLDAGVPCPDVP